ncbi:VWA domain-containing protein [Desulfitobacterium sp. PCE1]|uniref:VWA domain-containing protein n=1 Tax=Desulfitobacterium sp. PCE1 TaxID=146907 RepID=UPI0003665DBC|nr:VWA domain-containing protein [Desulfitobacterium sp. PCE1]
MNGLNINGWQLLKLIYVLRSVGITITIDQVQDALKALTLFPDLSPQLVLKSLFIHRPEDHQLYDMVYDLLASTESSSPDSEHTAPGQCTGPDQGNTGDGSHQGIGTGQGGITLILKSSRESSQSSATSFQMPDLHYLMGLKGFPGTIEEEETQEFDFEKQVKFILGQSGFLTWSNSLELAKNRGEVSEDQWQTFEAYQDFWNRQIRQVLWQERLQSQNRWDILREVNWRFKPLNSFTADEEGMVHQALRQMGNRLAVHRGLSKKKASRGTLRVSSLLKEMVRGNGSVFRFEYETYVLKHPELIVLCDVSNSVAPFSQFLLYLCQRIKSRFRKVRLYLFIDGIWDITCEEWLNTGDSMAEIRSWGRKHSSGFTDYGKVFNDFAQNVLPSLSTKGTVLIMGDGRNNFRPAQAEYLQEIQEKVKHIFWLNPLEEKDWTLPDNLMKEYRRYCTQVFPCRNLSDLWQISKKVFS